VLLEGLNSPFGMALVGSDLFVADTDAVRRFPYRPGQTRITDPGTVVLRLPAGPINHHWTKNLIASADGRKLFVTVGSNSNVGERGMAAEAASRSRMPCCAWPRGTAAAPATPRRRTPCTEP
jgi:glucose/arabinose dehydrogenase